MINIILMKGEFWFWCCVVFWSFVVVSSLVFFVVGLFVVLIGNGFFFDVVLGMFDDDEIVFFVFLGIWNSICMLKFLCGEIGLQFIDIFYEMGYQCGMVFIDYEEKVYINELLMVGYWFVCVVIDGKV